MDVLKILSGLKGKVLDAAHFELLQSAYELQKQNIDQLKENNSAIKESNELLKEKNEQLFSANQILSADIEELKSKLPKETSPALVNLSESAISILTKCIELDVTNFYDQEFVKNIPYSKVKLEAAIDELEEINFLELGITNPYAGSKYNLTNPGKKFALQLLSK